MDFVLIKKKKNKLQHSSMRLPRGLKDGITGKQAGHRLNPNFVIVTAGMGKS